MCVCVLRYKQNQAHSLVFFLFLILKLKNVWRLWFQWWYFKQLILVEVISLQNAYKSTVGIRLGRDLMLNDGETIWIVCNIFNSDIFSPLSLIIFPRLPSYSGVFCSLIPFTDVFFFLIIISNDVFVIRNSVYRCVMCCMLYVWVYKWEKYSIKKPVQFFMHPSTAIYSLLAHNFINITVDINYIKNNDIYKTLSSNRISQH